MSLDISEALAAACGHRRRIKFHKHWSAGSSHVYTGVVPDPGGSPGRYRYWDGSSWSAQTGSDPSQSPPGSQTGAPPERKSNPTVILGALAVVLVIVVAGVLVVRNGTGGSLINLGSSDPSVSAWDDRTPTTSPTPEQPTSAPEGPLVDCPRGDPDARTDHPPDGRVYGGNLSFPAEPSFPPAEPEPRLSFAYDVTQQALPVSADPGWIAQLAVGQLRASDGFDLSAQKAAERVAECSISGDMYMPYNPVRKDLRSEAITISGHSGWLIETDVEVDKEDLPFAGDRIIFVVVENGEDWGLFFGATPIGDQALLEILHSTVAQLEAS